MQRMMTSGAAKEGIDVGEHLAENNQQERRDQFFCSLHVVILTPVKATKTAGWSFSKQRQRQQVTMNVKCKALLSAS